MLMNICIKGKVKIYMLNICTKGKMDYRNTKEGY